MLRDCKLVGFAVLSLTAAASSQDEPQLHDLSTTAAKGTTAWFREVTTMAAGADNTTTHTRTFRVSIKQVTKKGGRIVEFEITRVRGSLDYSGMDSVKFDSAMGAARKSTVLDAAIDKLQAGVGQRFTLRVDKHGKLVGTAESALRRDGAKPGNKDIEPTELQRLVESAFGFLPDQPVPIGGTWKNVLNVYGAKARNSITLTECNEGSFTTSISRDETKAANANPAGGADSTEDDAPIIANLSSSGRQRIDRRDGLAEVCTFKHSFEMGRKQRLSKFTIAIRLRRIKAPGSGPADEARIAKTNLDTRMIADAVRNYYVMNARLPKSLAQLAQPDQRGRSILTEVPNDPWGNAYKLDPGKTPRQFRVISAGPDGKFGTADDITNKKR